MMANIVGLIVVIFVAIAFITLTIFYFASQKKLILCGLEDDAIRKDVNAKLSKTRKHYRSVSEAEAYFAKQKRRTVRLRKLMWVLSIGVYVAVIGFIVFSNMTADSRHIWFGNTAMLTIETESMETANESNRYLFGADGSANENDRILQYTFLTVSRDPAHIASIREGDIVAFSMHAADGASEMTVVHRLIAIEQGDNGEPLYTFRGDANALSFPEEIRVSGDRIVGVFTCSEYRGYQNLLLGHFVSYLRSPTGMTMATIALLLILIYMLLADRFDRVYEKKYAELKRHQLERMLKPQPSRAPGRVFPALTSKEGKVPVTVRARAKREPTVCAEQQDWLIPLGVGMLIGAAGALSVHQYRKKRKDCECPFAALTGSDKK